MITTIIFDLAEVYLYGMKNVERRIEKFLGKKIKNAIDEGEDVNQFFLGKITEEELWQRIIEEHHFIIDIATLKRLIRENMTEVKGTRSIIETLRKNGYTLGLLSVHGREWIEYCEKQFDYHKLFHSVTYSFEVGVRKPSPKAFQLILEKLKVEPAECLFIDDSMINIEAAKNLGIKTIQFKDPLQLKRDLIGIGVRV
jgi:putative hydrolase of the HAD superfamily